MAKKKNKKRKFIVDKKNTNTPYHLKKRNSNIMEKWYTKFVIWAMILAFVIGPVVGVLIYVINK